MLICACSEQAEQGTATAPAIVEHTIDARTTAADTSATTSQFPAAGEHTSATLTSTVIDAPNGTFGYDILSNGKLFVHQTNLPGQPGNNGCKTKADAEKLAALVIEKIRKGEMPPTVNSAELKELGIIP